MESNFPRAHMEMWQQEHTTALKARLPSHINKAGQHALEPFNIHSMHDLTLLLFGSEMQHSKCSCPRKLCCMQGILIFSGCISTEEPWMATNCSH